MENLVNDALMQAGAIGMLTGLLVEGIKQAFLPNDTLEKGLPLLSMAIGVVLGVIYAVVSQDDLILYAVAGLIGGGFASGLYDAVSAIIKKGG